MALPNAPLGSPGVQRARVGQEWPRLRQLCFDQQLDGNDLPDAWLSATVARQGEHLISFDRAFRKMRSRSQFTLLASRQGQRNLRSVPSPRSSTGSPTTGTAGAHRFLHEHPLK